MTIKVTLGICVRNCDGNIKKLVNCLYNQDYPHNSMEMIFVDDGSTDKTYSVILDSIQGLDLPVKVFRSKWRGLGMARNTVVNNAGGAYILWIDGDMELSRDFVMKQVGFMDSNPKVGAAKASYKVLNDANMVVMLENVRAFDLSPNSPKLFGTGGSIYRTRAIREAGGFDESIKGAGEDIDALINMRNAGWLLSMSDAEFYEKFKETWRSLWRQYYWWGYGAHYVWHKHKHGISVVTRLPLVAFLIGFLRFIRVYKMQRKLAYLLLPLQNFFKETAWCFGFLNSHFEGYGHAGLPRIR